MRIAGTNYFRTIEIPLKKGRFFTEDDTQDKPPVVIIDEKFAQRFWPGSDPIGKHVWFDPKKPITIVGVVGVVKQYSLEIDGKMATYFPQNQSSDPRMFLAVRTSSDPARLSSTVVSEIHAVDPDVVVYGIRTMQERLYDSLARQRFSSSMLGAFAVFALLLAAVGLYGVMSHLVMQGTHDIGVLVTLGARPGDIVGLVVRQGMELAGVGIALGLAGAAALTRVMASLLFGVSTTDVATFAAVPVLLAAVAFAATGIPAWRHKSGSKARPIGANLKPFAPTGVCAMAVRLEHANLTVRDIEGMIHFLQTAFPEFRVRGEGTSQDGSRWVHVGTQETYIALSPAKTEPEKRWTPYRGLPGVNHLAYEVDDVEALCERMKSAGYRESTPPNAHPFRKRRYFYDSEGNDWEFVEYLSEDPADRNDYKLPDR